MSTSVKVGGSWNEIESAHVKVGGSWNAVDSIWVKVAGAWEKVYNALALFAGGALTASFDTAASGQTVSVGYRFNRDGTYEYLNGGVWTSGGDWITPTSATIGDEYEVEMTELGNSVSINIAAADGSYNALSSTRTYSDSLTVTNTTENFTYTIREIANTANNTTGTIAMTTEINI